MAALGGGGGGAESGEEVEGTASSGMTDEDEAYTDEPWVSWFCKLKGNEFFAVIPDEFLLDSFELYGIPGMIRGGREQYEKAMKRLLDEEEQAYSEQEEDSVEEAAELVYGIAHSRYILTCDGLKQMREKFERHDFGTCPRAYCSSHAVLPLGETSTLQAHRVKIYCAKCNDIYYPKSRVHKLHLDGAYWGPSFPHLFYGQYPELIPSPSAKVYVPRVYGYRTHNPALREREAARIVLLLEDNPYASRVKNMDTDEDGANGSGSEDRGNGAGQVVDSATDDDDEEVGEEADNTDKPTAP